MSDKYSTGLIETYEKLFNPLKTRKIKYLEIGILNGGSLMWAKEYFKKGKIYGIDINLPPPIDGITMAKISQRDQQALHEFAFAFGPFDIIVDDASHMADPTRKTFETLYPFLKEKGYYIIEDWAAGFVYKWATGMPELVAELVWEYGGIISRTRAKGAFAIIGDYDGSS